MNPRITRFRALGVLTSALLGVGSLAPATANAADAVDDTMVGFAAKAYGSHLSSDGKTLSSGPLGLASLSCTSRAGLQNRGDVAAVDLGAVGRLGAVESKVATVEDGGANVSVARTHLAGGQLLGGLVSFDGITSRSTARTTDGETFSGTSESKLVGLTVAGKRVEIRAGENSTVELRLPGVGSIGKLEVNKKDEGWFGGHWRVRTEALHVSILADNPLGIEVGTHLSLGVSYAGLTGTVRGLTTGDAYATKATVDINGGPLDGQVLHHGPTAWAPMPCSGGERKANIAAIDLRGVVHVGAGESVTRSTVEGKVEAFARNRIVDLDIANGLITAEAITAQTRATREPGILAPIGSGNPLLAAGATFSDEGTSFADLRIAGKSLVNAEIGPNTTIDVEGLGTVTLRKTVRDGGSIAVTMLELEITDPAADLPVGAVVRVGHAHSWLVH